MCALFKYLIDRPTLLWIVVGAPVFFGVTQALPPSTVGTVIVWGAWFLILCGCMIGPRLAQFDTDPVSFNRDFIAKRFPRFNAVVDRGMDFAIVSFCIYYLFGAADRGVIGELGRGSRIEVAFYDRPIEFLFTFGLLLLFIALGVWRLAGLLRRPRLDGKQ